MFSSFRAPLFINCVYIIKLPVALEKCAFKNEVSRKNNETIIYVTADVVSKCESFNPVHTHLLTPSG